MADVRRLALTLLGRIQAGEQYASLAVSHTAEALSSADRARLTALLYGTLERKITLDYYLGVLAARSDFDPVTKDILRLGLYEILYMNSPDHAAVNEAVRLTRSRGEASFVNAVLRAALRRRGELTPPPREKNLARHLSVRYALPVSTVRYLCRALGEEAEPYMQSLEELPPLTLRIQTERISRDAYLALLRERGLNAYPTPYSSFGVSVTTPTPVRDLPYYEEGYFFVQDEASQIAVSALGISPGEHILDVCAAPGGKSFSAAILTTGTGHVTSNELHESKCSLIVGGAERLGLSDRMDVCTGDATVFCPAWSELYDAVLCDVPCSGLGVLRKKPDLRHRDITKTLSSLPPLQSEILSVASRYVRVGGRLLYSTCTLLPEENGEVVSAFLSAHPDFVRVPFTVGELSSSDGSLTLLTHLHHTDGFFMTLLERKAT